MTENEFKTRCNVTTRSTGVSSKGQVHTKETHLAATGLCLAEKLCILTAQNASLFNKKSELVTKCRLENKFFVATNLRKRRSNR